MDLDALGACLTIPACVVNQTTSGLIVGMAPACFHSGISGWFSLSLNPLARGCRRIWRGEIWKYGFGGAVADFV